MVRKPFRIVLHAIKMLKRTLYSYVMLSVTIVLSFSLLLGYLVYTDSALYNRYKKIFSQDRNVVSLYDAYMDNQKVEMLLRQVEDMEQVWHYITYETTAQIFRENQYQLEDGRNVLAHNSTITCIPNQVWGLYDYENEPILIHYLDGEEREGVFLNAGEALMDEITFRMLGLDKMENPTYNLVLRNINRMEEDKEEIVIPVKIVGTFSKEVSKNIVPEREGMEETVSLSFVTSIYLSIDDFSPNKKPDLYWQRRFYFYSETPELITQMIDRFSYTSILESSTVVKEFAARGVYEAQNEALEKMQIEARTKAMIAGVLLIILGINLYSSFTNALNDRKFEIGVKRAIGATSWDIVRQFLYESMFVMGANIVLSISLVTNIMIVYKYIFERIPNESGYYSDWIIYVTPYSIAMFFISSISLTIVFSLIFAYKSTQVEIVQYLKSE